MTNPFPGTCHVDRAFDFSTFPFLEVLIFDSSLTRADTNWEVSALETLNPATCPRLRRLGVVHPSDAPEGLIHQMSRIQDAFKNITVTLNSVKL